MIAERWLSEPGFVMEWMIKIHTVFPQYLISPLCLIQDHDPRVAETAVVGRPHDVYGEGKGSRVSNTPLSAPLLCPDIYAFVVLKDGVMDNEEGVVSDIQQLVRKHIGGFAVPQSILVWSMFPLQWNLRERDSFSAKTPNMLNKKSCPMLNKRQKTAAAKVSCPLYRGSTV